MTLTAKLAEESKFTVADALIVQSPYAEQIVQGLKRWEIRKTNTRKRHRIGIIKSGSSTVIGEVDVVSSFQADRQTLDASIDKHCCSDLQPYLPKNAAGGATVAWVWVLANAHEYKSPKPYHHPGGAQCWVKLQSARAANETTDDAKLIFINLT